MRTIYKKWDSRNVTPFNIYRKNDSNDVSILKPVDLLNETQNTISIFHKSYRTKNYLATNPSEKSPLQID